MVRYRAVVAYDGSFCQGFQIQAGVPTIQGELEQALTRVLSTPTGVTGAGRTDAGVHATGQVIAFDAAWRHRDDALLKALNMALPPYIAVQSIRQHPGFHPRFDALSRTYRYDVAETDVRQPLLQQRAWQVTPVLSRDILHRAAALLVGEHDFATFGSPPKEGEHTVRQVFVSAWSEQSADYGALLSYRIEATAFLKHMVRRIVAMLVAAGRGWITFEQFERAFRSADLKHAKPPAPPQGLFLESVKYSD
jgi:tRNA pseudouridine38-40 synthase